MLAKTDTNFRNSNIPAMRQMRPKMEKPSNKRSPPKPANVRPMNMSNPLLMIIMRLKNFRCALASALEAVRECMSSAFIA